MISARGTGIVVLVHLWLGACPPLGWGQGMSVGPPRPPTALARPLSSGPQESPRPPVPAVEPPIPILLGSPNDLADLLKRVDRPDFQLIRGGDPTTPGGQLPPPTVANPAPVVTSFAVRGEVLGELAHLTIQAECRLDHDGPAWIPLRMDGLTVNDVREGTSTIPSRTDASGTSVEVRGKGPHRIEVDVRLPTLTLSNGHSLAMIIPAVASTSVALRVPGAVETASAGPNESLACVPVEAGHWTQITSRLSPRSRLQVEWRVKSESATLPALLSVRGEIALDADVGLLKARSNWSLSVLRGQLDRLRLSLSPEDEVLDVELDGRPVAVAAESEKSRGTLEIPLVEPLRPGTSRTLSVSSRRTLSTKPGSLTIYRGIAFQSAADQAGVIAITQNPGVWLRANPQRGLRRIDPRVDLPQELRARPSTSQAFRFNDLPFDLEIGVDLAAPRLRTETRTTIQVEPGRARVHSDVHYESSRGRPQELRIRLTDGFRVDRVGPAQVVENYRIKEAQGPGPLTGRVLEIRTGRSQGGAELPEEFDLIVEGTATIPVEGEAQLPLLRPEGVSNVGGRIALLAASEIWVSPEAAASESFRTVAAPPAGWAWPSREAESSAASASWFRHDALQSAFPVLIRPRPIEFRSETRTTNRIGKDGVDWIAEVRLSVDRGALRSLEIELPEGVTDWRVAGVELLSDKGGDRPAPGTESDPRRHRLDFNRSVSGNTNLRIRGKIARAPGTDWRELPEVKVLGGVDPGRTLQFEAGPGIQLRTRTNGWVERANDASAPRAVPTDAVERDPAQSRIVQLEHVPGAEGAPEYLAEQAVAPNLPAALIARCWIRTRPNDTGGRITQVRFPLTTSGDHLDFALPTGSRLLRVTRGGDPVSLSRTVTEGSEAFRIALQSELEGRDLPFEMTYEETVTGSAGLHEPPRFLGDCVVMEAAWEVIVGDHLTGVGVPSGWTDENLWVWSGTHFLRRPARNGAELLRWVFDPTTSSGLTDSDEVLGHHGYLFGRAGGLVPLRFRTVSRVAVVSLCSGTTLIVGLLLVTLRAPGIVGLLLVTLVSFLLGCVAEPNIALLIVQSSSFGFALSLAAAGLHRYMEPTGRPVFPSGEISATSIPSRTGSGTAGAELSGSSLGPEKEVGSTAIRRRPLPSTADRLILAPTQPVPDPSSPPSETGPVAP